MPESHETADKLNQAHAEREHACAGFQAECADLMQSVEAGLPMSAQPKLSPIARDWAIDAFPELEPQEAMLTACAAFENDERQFDPAYDVATDDPDLIRADIEALMAEQALLARNQNTTGQIADGVPAKVPAEVGKEAASLQRERRLTVKRETLNDTQTELLPRRDKDVSDAEHAEGKTKELRELQTTFDQLRADGVGSADALRQVIAQTENPETRKHLNAILSRVALLQTALPDKPDAVDQLLNTTGLNLAAATVAGSFADFMTAAETDETLTDEDRATLRKIIKREDRYAHTGSDVQDELAKTLTTPDGKIIPAHPEDQPYQFREHVHGFADPHGYQHLRATTTHGEWVTLDITGWPAADVGRASELMQLWAMTENEGQTGYLTSLTKLNWTDSARIDPIALQQAAQVVSAVLGHGEGHDGDIFDGRDAIGLIRWQAQLANPDNRLMQGSCDAEHTHNALRGLGIQDQDGNLDLDVLRAFGDYSRDNWNTAPDYEAVRAHLAKLFPNKFA